MKKTTETAFEYIQRLCTENDVSLSEACREVDIERSTLEHWKKKDPKTLDLFFKLEQYIQHKKAK